MMISWLLSDPHSSPKCKYIHSCHLLKQSGSFNFSIIVLFPGSTSRLYLAFQHEVYMKSCMGWVYLIGSLSISFLILIYYIIWQPFQIDRLEWYTHTCESYGNYIMSMHGTGVRPLNPTCGCSITYINTP